MIWAPYYLNILISKSYDETFVGKVNKEGIDHLVAKIKDRILNHPQEISQRELKVCYNVIAKNSNGINQSKKIKALLSLIHLFVVERIQYPFRKTVCQELQKNPYFNFYFLCNIDGPDWNQAILNSLNCAMEQEIPIITTQSLLNGCDLVKGNHWSIIVNIAKTKKNWKIYKKEEWIVFIPRSYPYSAEEIGLDLTTKDEVKQLGQVLQSPSVSQAIDGFFRLFKSDNLVKKRMILMGHGDVNFIGGLSLGNYQKLIKYLESSKCEYLEIISCFTGSDNILSHHFQLDSSFKKEILKSPSFPIMVRSAGAFPTSIGWRSPHYFQKLNSLLSQKPLTLSNFRKMIVESNQDRQEDEEFQSFIQINLSFPYNSPGGFHPLGEDPFSEVISYQRLRLFELEKKESVIRVRCKKYILITPIKISAPLYIEYPQFLKACTRYEVDKGETKEVVWLKKTPLIISMVPGKAFHVISELRGGRMDLLDFFVTHAQAYKDSKAGKALFICNFELDSSTYTKVMIHLTNTSHLYFIDTKGVVNHYQTDLKNEILTKSVITEGEFAFEVELTAGLVMPLSEAMKKSNGGQEGLPYLLGEDFWQKALPHDFLLYKSYLCQEITLEQFFDQLSKSSHFAVLKVALEADDNQLVQLILEKGVVDINKRDNLGQSLLFYPFYRRNRDLIRLFIQKKINLNIPIDQEGNTPLHQAVIMQDVDMTRLLLESGDIDFEAVNDSGFTALMNCSNIELVQLILEAIKKKLRSKQGVKEKNIEKALLRLLNQMNPRGYTLLSLASSMKSKNFVEDLLNIGADPYAGNPTPLSEAILRRDKEMVEFWLDKKVDANRKNGSCVSSLEVAFKRGTEEILSLVLSRVSKIRDPLELLEKAIEGGYKKNIMKGLDLPGMESVNYKVLEYIFVAEDQEMWDSIRRSLSLNNAFLTDDQIFRLFQTCAASLSETMAKNFIEMFATYLHSHQWFLRLDWFMPTPCLDIAYKRSNEFLVELLLKSGANPTKTSPIKMEFTFLEMVIQKEDKKILKLCLETHRSDMQKTFNKFLYRSYTFNKFNTFKFLLMNGADLKSLIQANNSLFFDILFNPKIDWLKECLEHLCPEKKGEQLPGNLILEAWEEKCQLPDMTFDLLREYGLNYIKFAFNKNFLKKITSTCNNISQVQFILNKAQENRKEKEFQKHTFT